VCVYVQFARSRSAYARLTLSAQEPRGPDHRAKVSLLVSPSTSAARADLANCRFVDATTSRPLDGVGFSRFSISCTLDETSVWYRGALLPTNGTSRRCVSSRFIQRRKISTPVPLKRRRCSRLRINRARNANRRSS